MSSARRLAIRLVNGSRGLELLLQRATRAHGSKIRTYKDGDPSSREDACERRIWGAIAYTMETSECADPKPDLEVPDHEVVYVRIHLVDNDLPLWETECGSIRLQRHSWHRAPGYLRQTALVCGGQLSPCWATQGPSGDSQTNMLVIGSAIVEKVYVLTSHGQHEMHLSRVWRNMVSKVSTQSRTRTALRQASHRKLAGSGIAWRTTVGNQGRFEEAFIRIAPCAPICQSPDGQQIVATVLVPKLEGGESSKGPRLGIGHALVRILVR